MELIIGLRQPPPPKNHQQLFHKHSLFLHPDIYSLPAQCDADLDPFRKRLQTPFSVTYLSGIRNRTERGLHNT